MQAIDLTGTYQLYQNFAKQNNLKGDYFQLFVDYTSFHFQANVEMFMSSGWEITNETRQITFRCIKKDFTIDVTQYPYSLEIDDLLLAHYRRHKNQASAQMLYNHSSFTSTHYLMILHDFLSGRINLNDELNSLQTVYPGSRTEISVYNDNDSLLFNLADDIEFSLKDKLEVPLKQFLYIELTSSGRLTDKTYFYQQYIELLNPKNSTWENLIHFCGRHLSTAPEIPTLFDIIGAYAGGISPYTVPMSTSNALYTEAEKQFSQNNPDSALVLLKQSVNYEGVSAQNMNLTGATLRLLEKQHMALPYLIMGFMLNPEQQFLIGNMLLCLNEIEYPHTNNLTAFVSENYTIDQWSKNQIESINK
ncbi:MAG: hypothetical protein K9G70_08115 [Prolixibacteraceae bacterium]|nr:hypothetical protein [Prolixibacteraceae bacterium]